MKCYQEYCMRDFQYMNNHLEILNVLKWEINRLNTAHIVPVREDRNRIFFECLIAIRHPLFAPSSFEKDHPAGWKTNKKLG